MLRWPVVKICGLTTVENATMVVDAGATAIGLVLDESRRQVSPLTARQIADEVRGRADVYCVFRGSNLARIRQVIAEVRPDVVQLHGAESLEDVTVLISEGVTVVKALEASSPHAVDFDVDGLAALLLDGSEPGSGRRADFAPLLARTWHLPVIAAGGLTPATVTEVITRYPINGVDVSSGVESSPGQKDPTLVSEFVRAATAAFAQRESGDVQWT
jgi:phosphoribosylanthranilate isomerase